MYNNFLPSQESDTVFLEAEDCLEKLGKSLSVTEKTSPNSLVPSLPISVADAMKLIYSLKTFPRKIEKDSSFH